MVHQYKLNGYNIVLDTCSGSVHSVDDVAYDIIAMYKTASREEIVDAVMKKYGDRPDVTRDDVLLCIDDVESLEKSGKLFTEDSFKNLATTFKERSGNVIKALCLHVAHTCNLNCSYCFASQGKYHGDRAVMSFETGKRALDFLIENSGSRRNLEVDFFGGEPLMNWDTVKKLVEGFINPVVQFIVGSGSSLATATWHIELFGRTADFAWGAAVSSAITLIATALVIYWLVNIFKLDKLDKKKS